MEPLYSICVIARNEAKTLPKLVASLKEFMERGGDVNVLDTGSKDGTPELARSLGCKVKEVGEVFLKPVKNPTMINSRFVVSGEKNVVQDGDRYFDFSAARNCCAEMADNDVIFWYDADEVASVMDIDHINALIKDGATQFEYFFVFAHDQFGNEAVKFVQCKAYDRRIMHWTGRVHELVMPINKDVHPKRVFIPENLYKLAHFQNHEAGRHSYIIGLAVDCYEFPHNDRHSHYFAREMMYNGRPKSALKEFKRHTTMGGWHSERAESFLFMGDISGQLNAPADQARYYNEAFYIDSSRNAALIKLALFYRHNGNFQAAVCYAKAALEIPYSGFYADNLANYRELPHEILYTCYGYMGRIQDAQQHIEKALEYQPYNPTYLRDTQYYFEFGCPDVEGWMRWPEIKWLHETAKTRKEIVEVGSWKGRSTTALCSGNRDGKVYAVDTWAGSADERDSTNWMAKQEDVYATFLRNTAKFKNLTPIRMESAAAAETFQDKSLDMVFIDAGHTAEEVRRDILAWLPKVKDGGIICGHDYDRSTWMTVCEGVDSVIGKPDGVCDSIWWFNVSVKAETNGYVFYGKEGFPALPQARLAGSEGVQEKTVAL